MQKLDNSITDYYAKWSTVASFQEAAKHDLLASATVKDLGICISSFEQNIGDVRELLVNNVKIDCSELLSRAEIEQLVVHLPSIKDLSKTMRVLQKALASTTEENEELVPEVKSLKRRVDKIVLDVDTAAAQLGDLEEKLIRGEVVRLRQELVNQPDSSSMDSSVSPPSIK